MQDGGAEGALPDGGSDAVAADGSGGDVQRPDAPAPDALAPDAPAPDGGAPDAPAPEGGAPDAPAPDGGGVDAPPLPDGGGVDVPPLPDVPSPPDATVMDVVAADVRPDVVTMDAPVADVVVADVRPDVLAVDSIIDVAPDAAVTRTAFRLNSLSLRDPHAFTAVFGICIDVTSQVNTQFGNAVTMDTTMPADGLLDLSVVNLFSPLSQSAPTSPFALTFPNCTSPLGSTRCTFPPTGTSLPATATNQATGNCLNLVAGSTRASYGATTVPSGPCYSAPLGNVSFTISGINIPLQNVQVGATYMGAPATQLINGLMYGFLSVSAASGVTLPTTLPLVGGRTLASILAGGPTNCQTGANSDLDTSAGVQGWWVYLSFTAVPVPYM